MVSPLTSQVRIQDRILQSILEIESFGMDTASQLIQSLDDARDVLAARISRTGRKTVNRAVLRDIQRELTGVISEIGQDYGRILSKNRTQTARIEYDSMTRVLREQLDQSVRESLYRVPADRLQAALSSPVGGIHLQDYVNRHLSNLAGRIRRSIMSNLVLGDSTLQAAADLRASFNLTRKGASVLARTSILQAGEDARNMVYTDNQDVILGYKYVATLDVQTCPICAADDGRIEENRNDLPPLLRHPSCRCAVIPLTRFSREVERPAKFEQSKRTVTHRDKNPITGRPQTSTIWKNERVGKVKPGTSFNDFFNRQSEEWRKDWLGPGRFDLWKKGKLTVFDGARNNRILTLRQLEQRKGTPLAKRRRKKASQAAIKKTEALPSIQAE